MLGYFGPDPPNRGSDLVGDKLISVQMDPSQEKDADFYTQFQVNPHEGRFDPCFIPAHQNLI